MVFTYNKMSKDSLAKYYQNDKERLQKRREKEEDKNKKQQYGHERYKNVFEDEKQRLVKYRKKILLNAEK